MSLLTRLFSVLCEATDASVLDKSTPTPTKIAKKHGVSLSSIEAQLALGIRVEQEHTTSPAVAREIALDHLNEVPNYYTKLLKVEQMSMSSGALPDRGMMPAPFPVLDQHIPNDPRFLDAPLRRVPLHLVHATQRTIDAENVKKFIDDPMLGGKPVVALHDSGYAIVDGHHRMSAARMRGETHVLAHVVEDAPANAAGTGAVAGLGVGPKGEPGVMLPRKKKIDEDTFAGADVLDTDMDVLMAVKEPKKRWERYAKYVGVEEGGEAIRQHARKSAKDIILRDSKTGTMTYLRKRGWHK